MAFRGEVGIITSFPNHNEKHCVGCEHWKGERDITWCPKPQYGTKRKYTANIGENSSRHILLLKSPEEYSYHELLELSDEAVTCYIKIFLIKPTMTLQLHLL